MAKKKKRRYLAHLHRYDGPLEHSVKENEKSPIIMIYVKNLTKKR